MTTPPKNSPRGRLVRAFHPADPIDALEAITGLRQDLVEAEDHAALLARQDGATWQEIADALGITRQAAHQRWGHISSFAGWDRADTR